MSAGNLVEQTSQGLADTQSYINNLFGGVVTPLTAQGVSGFVFDVPDIETVTLDSEITDHYTENNTFIQDQIVNKPVKIALTGLIGEVVFRAPTGLAKILASLASALATVSAYAPSWSQGGIQKTQAVVAGAQNGLNALNSYFDLAQNMLNVLSGSGSNKQTIAFNKLDALRSQKTICTVQTPYKYYPSMVIETISFTRNSDSNDLSSISITLKEFRAAEVQVITFDQNLFPPANQVQGATAQETGVVKGAEDNDLLTTMIQTVNPKFQAQVPK